MKCECDSVSSSMRVSAETRLNASSHIQMRRAPRHLGSCIQQSPANHVQVSQRGRHFEAMPVLIEPSVTNLLESKDSFDDTEHMLHLGANSRLGAVGGLDRFVNASVPAVSSIREVPSTWRRGPDRGALPLIALVAPHPSLFAVQQVGYRQGVRNIRRRHQNRVDQFGSAIDADMGFHPKKPLFSLRRLMHLRISYAVFCLKNNI